MLAGFEAAWCAFRWDEPQAVRVARAARFTTAPAGADLVVAEAWWDGQVVPNRTVATCTDVRVLQVNAPRDATHTVLAVSAVRTSLDTATGGAADEPVTDQRQLVVADGRWLVGDRMEGG